MIEWIAQNAGTIAALAALLCLIGAAAACVIRRKKRGKTSCGCSGCPMNGSCGEEREPR